MRRVCQSLEDRDIWHFCHEYFQVDRDFSLRLGSLWFHHTACFLCLLDRATHDLRGLSERHFGPTMNSELLITHGFAGWASELCTMRTGLRTGSSLTFLFVLNDEIALACVSSRDELLGSLHCLLTDPWYVLLHAILWFDRHRACPYFSQLSEVVIVWHCGKSKVSIKFQLRLPYLQYLSREVFANLFQSVIQLSAHAEMEVLFQINLSRLLEIFIKNARHKSTCHLSRFVATCQRYFARRSQNASWST